MGFGALLMKGPRELKNYVARHRKHLKAIHWDSLLIFKLERCKKWFKRNKRVDWKDDE
jgi:hypothetical protein